MLKPKTTSSKPATRKRGPKANSAAGLLLAMVNASKGLLRPLESAPVSPEAMPFWDNIIKARARDEWDEVGLTAAAELAECQRGIVIQTAGLQKEGYMIGRGKQMRANPRVHMIDVLSRRQLSLMRALRFGGRISGDTRKDLVKRQVEKDAREALESLDADELLAQ